MKQVYITNVIQKSLMNGKIKFLYGELRCAQTRKLIKGMKLADLIEYVYNEGCAEYEVVKLLDEDGIYSRVVTPST